MNQHWFFRTLSVLAIAWGISMIATPGVSQGRGKGKAKEKVETKENHGRDAGGLPFGLETYMEKKGDGELPSGLQNKKNDDGSLTRGLEEGGKPLKSTSKGKKAPKW
jgi:hypothetical protein